MRLPVALALLLAFPAASFGAGEGFEPMPKPKPGEWLHEFKEEVQSPKDHERDCANRARGDRKKVYVLPLGRIEKHRKALIADLKDYLGAFFGLESAILPAAEPPLSCWNDKRGQYDGDRILAWLKARVPADAVACGAFVEEDLFSDDLNFVFGLASLEDRVGVYSIARLEEEYKGMPDGATLLKRTLGLATHELGHIFGIDHCVKYRCNMNGSNSLEESDGQPLHFCPDDLEKLRWACGVDLAKRYEALEKLYAKHEMRREAAFCAARRKDLAAAKGGK